MSNKCSWLGCRDEGEIGYQYMRGASLCHNHHSKWCEVDKDLGPYPWTPEMLELKVRRVKAFLKNLREYSKEEDVSRFVNEKGDVISKHQE